MGEDSHEMVVSLLETISVEEASSDEMGSSAEEIDSIDVVSIGEDSSVKEESLEIDSSVDVMLGVAWPTQADKTSETAIHKTAFLFIGKT